MTLTHKIVWSSMTALALLLSGCGGGDSGDVAGDINNPPVTTLPPVDENNPPVTDPKQPVDPYKSAGWYGKTQVSATASDGTVYTHNTAGIFGELVQSDDEKDSHDISAYEASIFQVVFPQTEWVDDNGDYFSNYLNYDENSAEKRVWTFQIKNQHTVDLSNAAITINLDGVYDVSYKEENGLVEYKESTESNSTQRALLNLVDVDNRTAYTLSELKTANLNMDGLHTRTFKWVLGTVDSSDYMKPEVPMSKSASFSKIAETASMKTLTADVPTGGKFGLPPQ